jgi:hypothetical protein
MKMELVQKMDQLKVISKEWMYKNILNFSYEEAALQVEGLKKDAMLTFKLNNLETTGTEKPQDQQGMMGQQPPLGSDENGQPMNTDEPPVDGEEQPQEEPTPNGQPLNVEDQISKLKASLGGEDEEQPQQEAKAVGRPKEYSTRGKDKSPFGRDVIGSKDLKNQYKNESFIDMLKKNITKGGKAVISEGKSMLDEQNIIEN